MSETADSGLTPECQRLAPECQRMRLCGVTVRREEVAVKNGKRGRVFDGGWQMEIMAARQQRQQGGKHSENRKAANNKQTKTGKEFNQ
ncbi:hypothetical protein OUZ56_029484 [Daphnia magna]|uniref:Uncharacterized protein n=1 Tax=Daphnia magna TaxID=35525 RepID=A0ABR0B6Z1_9CRUS|nr:hypothetical protein OUZ56_029484 [Daphnia magna]